MPDLNLKPATDNYCVVGNPVTHSKSPQIHAAFAAQAHQSIYYQAIEVETGTFPVVLKAFRQQGGKGMNVTVPLKMQACQLSDNLSARATEAGAVNTIKFENNGECYGDNTDGIGLVVDLKNHAVTIHDSRILILGAGGAVRGILGPLLENRPASIVIANRTPEKARQLVERFSTKGTISHFGFTELNGMKFDIVVNATSAGLEGMVPPVPEGIFAECSCSYDLMYADQDTAFIDWAKKLDVPLCLDGLGMLIEQAAESFYIWREVRPDTRPIIEQFRMQ